MPDVRMVVPSHPASEGLAGSTTAVEVRWCSKQCFIALTASSQYVPGVTSADATQEPVRHTEKQIANVPSLQLQEVIVEAVKCVP